MKYGGKEMPSINTFKENTQGVPGGMCETSGVFLV